MALWGALWLGNLGAASILFNAYFSWWPVVIPLMVLAPMARVWTIVSTIGIPG